VIKSLNKTLKSDLALEFTTPKTKGNYKGACPPVYSLDGLDPKVVTKILKNAQLPDHADSAPIEKIGELYTITNNMVLGKRWNKKEFELKDGNILYNSHNKTKGFHHLFMCSVVESDGTNFTVPAPANLFPFVIQSLDPNNAWEMQLCADTADDREQWMNVVWKSICSCKALHADGNN
jgi:hypothetical protein